MSMSCSAALTD